MHQLILKLLKIKPHETSLVKKLFAVQFLLGVSTAFLFTSSLTSFISIYHIDALPEIYIVSAIFLFIVNPVYSRLDERMTSPKLLQVVILFAILSVFVLWLCLTIFDAEWLTLLLAGWYLLVYMLINYAFWGMASLMFNVRESHRLFSLVGAGDIPSKMLGYLSVTLLVPIIGVHNLLLISVATASWAWVLVRKYRKKDFILREDPNAPMSAHMESLGGSTAHNMITRFFGIRIVFFISLFSFISYIIFAFMDFTFLAGIKFRYSEEGDLAFFIGVFFASGRVLAVFFKVLFSSRLIAAIGLANSLLVTPVLLFIITLLLAIFSSNFEFTFYVFGIMVLVSEMLRSTLQEPVFFILFQPLKPHDRLKGHLIAKGHTMPLALLGVGTFLFFYLKYFGELSIFRVSEILLVFLLLWCGSVFFIKREYLQTLLALLRKGYFTGSQLFLNEPRVTELLVKKVQEGSPQEVIHALNLLEKSAYGDLYSLLMQVLESSDQRVKTYVLSRIIANNMSGALPVITDQLEAAPGAAAIPLYQAVFYLDPAPPEELEQKILGLSDEAKQAALVGLLLRKGGGSEDWVQEQVEKLGAGVNSEDRLLALAVIKEAKAPGFHDLLDRSLRDGEESVVKRAIETAGAVKDFTLLDAVITATSKGRYYAAFNAALLSYGDDVFKDRHLTEAISDDQFLLPVIKAAAKVPGNHATLFLFKLLEKEGPHAAALIHALWRKKPSLHSDQKRSLESYLPRLLADCGIKLSYHQQLAGQEGLAPLRDAIATEIRGDLQTLLKLFSFLYDTETMNRIIELIRSGNTSRFYNAIEMLELLLPAKYFSPTNELLEWLQDVRGNISQPVDVEGNTGHVLRQVLTNDFLFQSWTRSVACYVLLKLAHVQPVIDTINDLPVAANDRLFRETRDHVLSTLNH